MKTMLAAYLPGNSTVDLREVAVPTPGINQVLIKMKSSGICGSDVHYIYHQHRATAAAPDKPLYQGFINGHEPCGQIVAMMLAKGRGAKRIIGVDMLPERLAMAKQLGVMDHGYLATTEGLPQIIAELTHGGADVALDCSGNAAGRLLALRSTADWGRVVYIGETGKVEFEVSADLMHHQRRIIGSWVTSLFHMEKCAHDLTDWKLWPRNAITHRFSLEQAGDAYALMASGKCGKVVINFPD